MYGNDKSLLLIAVFLFAIMIRYSITLQYSAYFDVYFNIS